MAEVLDVNEDTDDGGSYPWGTQANAEAMRGQPNCDLPTLTRDGVPARDRRVPFPGRTIHGI